jgi:hypothetical protein
MQVPRKLGQFAVSEVMPNPYKISFLPTVSAEAVGTMLHTALRHSRQGQMGWLAPAILQQATESGLVNCIDRITKVTAQQLNEYSLTAEALAPGGSLAASAETLTTEQLGTLSVSLELLQYTSTALLVIQVCRCCGSQSAL